MARIYQNHRVEDDNNSEVRMKPTPSEQRTVNNNMRLLEVGPRSGSHVNCFKYFPNNTDDHEDKKYQVFKELRKQGIPVMVEAIFTTGGRCDILDLLNGEIYEVLSTESLSEAKKKVEGYPTTLTITFVRTEGNKAKYGD